MAQRTLLIDSDAFLILAGTSLLRETLDLLEIKPTAARRLHALPFMVERSARIHDKYDLATRQKALEACEQVEGITERPSSETLDLLASTSGIDEGEALLLGLACENEGALVLTGDKKAIIALSGERRLNGLCERLKGRVIMVEPLLGRLVDRHGLVRVGDRIRLIRGANKALDVLFSDANCAKQDHFREAMKSYSNDFVQKMNEEVLFIWTKE